MYYVYMHLRHRQGEGLYEYAHAQDWLSRTRLAAVLTQAVLELFPRVR